MPKAARGKRNEHAVFFWDFTISMESAPQKAVVDWLRQVAKQWVFQQEEGSATGYAHWQGRLNLKERTRKLYLPEEWKGDTSCTGVATVKGKKAFSYVMKEDTRVDGPWSDRDVFEIPDDVPQVDGLRRWQAACLAYLRYQNDRQILFLKDEAGNSGKTTLIRHLICRQRAIYVPPVCENAQQMGAYVHDAVKLDPLKRRIVVFDLPRAISNHQWRKIAPLIEFIKDGYAADGRNTAKFVVCAKPIVLVAYNSLPEGACLGTFFTHDKIDLWIDFNV